MLSALVLMPAYAAVSFVKLFDISTPNGVYDAMIDPASKNLAWMAVEKGTARVYLLDFKTRSVRSLGAGSIARQQQDCGRGFLSVETFVAGKRGYATYDLRTGARLGEFAAPSARRIGGLYETRDGYLDIDGKVVRRTPPVVYGQSNPDYIGTLIWDGKHRLSIVGKGDRPNDVKDVVVLTPDWKKGKRVRLSELAFGFDKLIGNPDTGPFAITERSNRNSDTTGVFTKDLRRLIDRKYSILVEDIGPHGVLAYEMKFFDWKNDTSPIGAICFDSNTGKVKWRGPATGRWFGKNVFAYDSIYSGKNGKLMGKLRLPSDTYQRLAFAGDVVYLTTKSNRLVAYRIAD